MSVRSAGSNIWNMSSTCCSFSGTPPSPLAFCLLPSRVLSLDRHSDHIAPRGPAAVVVADVLEPEQGFQREPRVAAALADAAVGNRHLVRRAVLGLEVELLHLLSGPEAALVAVVPA